MFGQIQLAKLREERGSFHLQLISFNLFNMVKNGDQLSLYLSPWGLNLDLV